MNNVVLLFDGLCEPHNPGGTGCYGYLILLEGEVIAEGKGSLGCTPSLTNNICEYAALIYGLQDLEKRGLLSRETNLECRGDSKLVICQVNGSWRINKEHLQRAVNKARAMLSVVGEVKMTWIPREENELADRLSQQAYEQATGLKVIPRKKK